MCKDKNITVIYSSTLFPTHCAVLGVVDMLVELFPPPGAERLPMLHRQRAAKRPDTREVEVTLKLHVTQVRERIYHCLVKETQYN